MNPVVETFAELFKPLERASEEVTDYRAKGKRDLEDWANQSINAIFSQAIGQYQGVTVNAPWTIKKTTFNSTDYGVVVFSEGVDKAAGDTITYDWSFDLPKVAPPEPVKRFRKRKK